MPRLLALSRRFSRSVRRRGLLPTLTLASRVLVGRFQGKASDMFDLEFGVDTATELARADFRGDPDEGWGDSLPIETDLFDEALQAQPIPHEQFVFLDLGCGKGRALMKAACFPFRQIVGIEYERSVWEAARTNLARFRPRQRRCWDVEILWADATAYEFPLEPLVVYLFCPFRRPDPYARIARRLADSLRRHPRDGYVIYIAPDFREAFDYQPELRCIVDPGDGFVIYRSAATADATPP